MAMRILLHAIRITVTGRSLILPQVYPKFIGICRIFHVTLSLGTATSQHPKALNACYLILLHLAPQAARSFLIRVRFLL